MVFTRAVGRLLVCELPSAVPQVAGTRREEPNLPVLGTGVEWLLCRGASHVA